MKKILLFTLLICQSVAILAADNWIKVGDLWYWYNDAKTQANVVAARNSETYTGLTGEITIPATIPVDQTNIPVTEIRASVFKDCANITSVVINAEITEIRDNCFQNCTGLTNINIPATVTTIKSNALRNCTSLGVVTIPNSVTTIEGSAFYYCTGMTEINIPASVTTIGGNAFAGCSALTKANFASYESLCNIDFNQANSNPLLNTYAELWIGGVKQTNLVIPAGVSTIKDYAFAGLNFVSSVDFSAVNGGLTIRTAAFTNNSGYNKVIFRNAEQLCSMDYYGVFSNPLYYGHHIYYSNDTNTEIKIVAIPASSLDTYNNVRPYIFAGASDMTRVDFPQEAIATRTGSFTDCTSIEFVGFASQQKYEEIYWEDNSANPFYSTTKEAIPLVNGAPLESLELSANVSAGKYQNAKWLKTVTLNTGVTEIGDQAFKGCTNLTTVTINGAAITTIGYQAFHGCQKLSDFPLPESLTSIGEEAFRNCEKFTTVTIPTNCTSLGSGAFVWCTQLKTVTISSDIDIPDLCFQNCGNLEQVITTTTKNIGNSAFSKCVKLKAVPTTAGLVEIGDNAFFECTSLTNVTLAEADHLTTIGEAAFKGCTNITMLSLPATTTLIKEYAFKDCANLEHVYFLQETTPAPVIYPHTFDSQWRTLHVTNPSAYSSADNWKDFYSIVSLTNVTLSFYVNGTKLVGADITQTAGSIIDPNLKPDVALYTDATTKEEFSGWDMPFPETMPSTNTNFMGYVTTTTTIDHFKYSLRPAQTIGIMDYANRAVLLGAEDNYITQSNHTISVPATVTNTKGTYNKTAYPVTAIADAAFENQGELTDVILTANITELGVGAFKGCSKLESINLAVSNVTILSENVFQNCTALSFAEIPNKITSIGKWALSNTGCSNVTIPSSITIMGDEVFKDCKSLETVTFADGFSLALPQMTFLSCGALKDVTLVGTMGSIGIRAFDGCGSLTTVYIPQGIERVGKQSFQNCNHLTNVTLPSTITQINEQAFKGCSTLAQIVVEATTVPSTYANAFDNTTYQHATVYVPNHATYSTVDPWQNFAHLVANGTYQLTYMVDGQQDGDIENKKAGEKITPRANNDADFDHWENLPQVMPAENVTAVAVFRYQSSSYTDTKKVNYEIFTRGENRWAEVKESPNAAGNIEIPASITVETVQYDVKAIQDKAFEGNRKITGMVLHEGITSIGEKAFYDNRFTTFTVPASVTTLGENAFRYCTTMTNITFAGNNIETLPTSVFQGCTSLPDVDIPSSVTSIGDEAFNGCENLTEITIPVGIENIGARAFSGCKKLETIDVKNATMPDADESTFDESHYTGTKLKVPTNADVNNLKEPWNGFSDIDNGENATQQCASPTISYDKGVLKYACTTPNSTVTSIITVTDAKQSSTSSVTLDKVYTITATARATGYTKSQPTIATITWRNGKPLFSNNITIVNQDTPVDPGDVNGDGVVNIADVTGVINIINQ